MLDTYCNQATTLKQFQSRDAYNQATYTTSTIMARVQYKRKQVRDKNGQSVISEVQVFTTSKVEPGDAITYDGKDWPVISVSDNVDLDGEVLFYEVML